METKIRHNNLITRIAYSILWVGVVFFLINSFYSCKAFDRCENFPHLCFSESIPYQALPYHLPFWLLEETETEPENEKEEKDDKTDSYITFEVLQENQSIHPRRCNSCLTLDRQLFTHNLFVRLQRFRL